MIVYINLYPGWFNDDISKRACEHLKKPIITTKQWCTLEQLYRADLPDGFDLNKLLKQEKIHALCLVNPENKKEYVFYLYPVEILKIIQRETRKRIRKNIE